ncbi:MAG: glycosyltransferase family 4 protein [Flavitalea sp.]
MKIIVFNDSFFPKSHTFIYHQILGLSKFHEVVLLASEYQNEELFPINLNKIVTPRFLSFIERIRRKYFYKHAKYTLNAKAYSAIKNALITEKPDVIHAHFGFSGLLILPIAKLLNIPLIVSFHGIDASPALLLHPAYRTGVTSLVNYCKQIIIVSAHMYKTLNLQQSSSKVHLIPYGIHSDFFHNPNSNKQRNQLNILHSGRICNKKGVPDLIRTFLVLRNSYDNIQLTIIGYGKEMKLCKKIVSNSKFRISVKFLYAQSQEVVRDQMMDADIFVLNSRIADNGDMEGTPVSILESMSMKLAVVSTFHAGIPEIISNEETGLLVQERNNAKLKDAIERLILDKTLRYTLGENARHRIIEKYTFNIMFEKLNSVFVS